MLPSTLHPLFEMPSYGYFSIINKSTQTCFIIQFQRKTTITQNRLIIYHIHFPYTLKIYIQKLTINIMSLKGLVLSLMMMALIICGDPKLDRHIIPLYGNSSLGYYYANIFVGSPAQEQSVIIDTGSGQLALPCSKCESCGKQHIHQPFNILKSSSNKIITCKTATQPCDGCPNSDTNNPCRFSISYAEGSSLSGILIEDVVKFQRDSEGEEVSAIFGCTTRQTNLFYTQAANGIFGLAPIRKAKLLESLYERHSKFTGQDLLFSMCLAKNGGQIAVGKVDKQIIDGISSIKTTFNQGRNLYSLEGVGIIKVNNTVLRSSQDLGYYGLFIDSGSTFSYFRRKQYNAFLVQLENSCAYHSDRCMVAKGKSMNCFKIEPSQGMSIKQTLPSIFPSIQIYLNDQVVSWTADKYFLLRSIKKKEICLGVEPLDRFLLGANWMVDRNIVFNIKEKTVQIFTGANCSLIYDEDRQLLVYTADDNGPLQYVSAVLKVNEDLIQKVLLLSLLIVLIFLILIYLGQKFHKNSNIAESTKNKNKNKSLPEQQNSTINQPSILISQRQVVVQQDNPAQQKQSNEVNSYEVM